MIYKAMKFTQIIGIIRETFKDGHDSNNHDANDNANGEEKHEKKRRVNVVAAEKAEKKADPVTAKVWEKKRTMVLFI